MQSIVGPPNKHQIFCKDWPFSGCVAAQSALSRGSGRAAVGNCQRSRRSNEHRNLARARPTIVKTDYRGTRSLAIVGLLVALLAGLGCASSARPDADRAMGARAADVSAGHERPRNIILFISDGCGPASFTLARDFLRTRGRASQLSLDGIRVGSVQTYATDALITDSASSATAYACGVKTRNGMIGMGPDSTIVQSVVEIAEAAGIATGLVATSRVTHATPASFAAHVPNRGMENEIAAQMVSAGVDLILGGGYRFFVPEGDGGARKDGRDLLAEARASGHDVALPGQRLEAITRLPAIGLFAADHLPYEVDREPGSIPSLAEMTTLALNLLSDDPDGFFLMVEGSRIDHAAHANDLGGHLHDILAYDEAIKVGLDFATGNGETLVISVSDHETGGLTIGRSVDGKSMYAWKPEVAAGLTGSHDAILEAIYDRGTAPADAVREFLGITDLTDSEVETLVKTTRSSANSVLGEIVGRRAFVGWTTGGHTAVDVNLYAFGPGSSAFHGHLDNAELGRLLLAFLK